MLKKKPFNLRPCLFCALALCLGIISGYLFLFERVFLGVLTLTLFILLSICPFFRCFDKITLKNKTLFAIFMVALFVFGCGIFNQTVKNFESASLDNHYFNISARVKEVQDSDFGKRLLLENISLSGIVNEEIKYKAYLFVTGENSIDLGDHIEFSAHLIDKSSVYEEKLATYDLLRGVKYTASVMAYEVKIVGNSLSIFDRANLFIRNSLSAGLDGQAFAVGYAMLTGGSEYMNTETLSSYRMAGIAHIFAVSGLHIGFLATALGFLCDKLKFSRLLKAILVTPCILFYAGICGFSASSIRAVIMCAVALFGSVNGNRYDPLSSLGIACVLVLFIEPLQLFSVGFLLSFGVVLGMILLAKPLSKAFSFLPEKIAQSLGSVLSAFLSSLPICLSDFNYIAPISIIVNLIFIPIVSLIFTALLILTIVGGIFGISSITLFISNFVLKFVNMCINAFDFKALSITGIVMGGFSVFYYLAMIIPSGILNLNRLTKLISTVLCVIICIVGTSTLSILDDKQANMYIIGSEHLSATLIDTPEQTILIASNFSRFSSMGRIKKITDANGIKNIDTVVFFDENFDTAQEFLTKLNSVISVEEVFYFGEKDLSLENIIDKSFGIKCKNFLDGQDVHLEQSVLTYSIKGNAVVYSYCEQKIAVFSSSQSSNFNGLNGELDYVICSENCDTVLNFYKPKTPISYRANKHFLDGESGGTLKFMLK